MFAQLFKEFIPADRFEMSFNGNTTSILLVGVGFSLEASRCSFAGLSGFNVFSMNLGISERKIGRY